MEIARTLSRDWAGSWMANWPRFAPPVRPTAETSWGAPPPPSGTREPANGRGAGGEKTVRRWMLGLLLAASVVPAWADLRRETEPNNDPSAAQPILPPTSLGGVIAAPGETDLYSARLEAGQKIPAGILAHGVLGRGSPRSQHPAPLCLPDIVVH